MHINAAQCNLHVNRVDDFDVHLARTGRFEMQVRSTRIGLIGPFGSLTTQELNLSCGFSVSFINLSFFVKGRCNAKRRKRGVDEEEDGEKTASNHPRGMMPSPPPLRNHHQGPIV